jgi:hypothetical protein
LVNAVLREIAATARRFPERLLPTAYIMKYGRERESDFGHPTFLPTLCLVQAAIICVIHESVPQRSLPSVRTKPENGLGSVP